MQEAKQQTEIEVISNNIGHGLISFDKRKSELQELEKQAHGLKIESIDDKETINQVSTIRKSLKSARVEIQKEGKSMRDPLTQMSKLISEKEKELIAIIEPTEKELMAQEKWVEDEKEKIRLAEIEAENQRIQDRADKLKEYGVELPYNDLKTISDETFEVALNAAKSNWEQEQILKAEEEKLRIEQEEKERAEKEAEQKRIEAERKELEELRQKQAEAQRIIDEQNAKIAAEKKAIEEEKARIEAEKQKAIDDKKRAEEIRIAQEKAAEAARLKAIEDAKEAERMKAEAEQKAKLAAERKAARQPDKIKILNYGRALQAVSVPDLKTEEAKVIFSNVLDLMSKLDLYIKKEAEKL